MREILFRGKRLDNGEWVEGCYYKQVFFYGDDREIHYIIISDEDLGNDYALEAHPVDPATVGQYTGLTDKNGERIFEGDILSLDCDLGEEGAVEEIDVVVWNDNGWQNKCKGCDPYPITEEDCLNAEVIGNIHDNPELVEGLKNGKE